MKTITLANMKGGVGKTSISVSLAAELAKYADTVLLDFDPQANTTAWIAPDNADMDFDIADVLQGKAEVKATLLSTGTPHLSLLPTFGISGELKTYIENAGELQINKAIKTLIENIAKEQRFLFCVIDLSPAFGKLERAALITADEVITPVHADRFSIDGLESIAANLLELKNLIDRPIAAYKRLVVNHVNRSIKRHEEILSELSKTAKQTIYTIPQDQVFFRAQSTSRPIQAMNPKPDTLAEISRLADDIRGVQK